MAPAPDRGFAATIPSASVLDTLEGVLRFGAVTLRAGDTAFRVRESMTAISGAMGLDTLTVTLGFGGITASARRGGETATLVQQVGAPGVDSGRIEALNALARNARPGLSPGELARSLEEIESAPPRHSMVRIATAIGAACGAFALLNGGTGLEVIAAAAGGGAAQALRSSLIRRRLNQYAVTSLSALAAAGLYCLLLSAVLPAAQGVTHHPVGFISSVLFLVPGFPAITALLDLVQYQTGAAVLRLAHATMVLLSAALGLLIVIAVVGFSMESKLALPPTEPVILLVRAASTFVGACAFAILFNSSWRTVLHVGVLAIIGNELRLALNDTVFKLPGATLLGALAVGLMASVARRWYQEARITLTVPAVIMMVPGLYALEALVRFNEGDMLGGLRAMVMVALVVGAMAVGLAAARFVSQPEWVKD